MLIILLISGSLPYLPIPESIAIPRWLGQPDPFWYGVVAITLTYGAYNAELFRDGKGLLPVRLLGPARAKEKHVFLFAADENTLTVEWRAAKGYYLYKKRMGLAAAGRKLFADDARFVTATGRVLNLAGMGQLLGDTVAAFPDMRMRIDRWVVDGDTVVVDIDGQEESVRLIGIDTPESVKPGAPVECFAKRASALNERLVAGERVRLVRDVEERDRYGRLLAYVYRARDGLFVNAELVRRGFATVATFPPNVAHEREFRRLANRARMSGRGLWSECEGAG